MPYPAADEADLTGGNEMVADPSRHQLAWDDLILGVD